MIEPFDAAGWVAMMERYGHELEATIDPDGKRWLTMSEIVPAEHGLAIHTDEWDLYREARADLCEDGNSTAVVEYLIRIDQVWYRHSPGRIEPTCH